VLFPIGLSPFALVLGAIGAAVGAVTLLLLSLPHVRRTILEERRLLSREDRPLISRVPVELFVLPVALFTFVELRGTAVQSTSARDQLDPLVLLTPTLLIFALSFLALRLLLWVLRRLDRPMARTKSLPTYLATRRLGRSPGTSFATSLLLVLAVGLLIVSTSYRAIVLRNHEDTARQQVGADWNVQIAVPQDQLVAAESVPPNAVAVVRSQPVFELPGSFTLSPSVIAVDPERFATGGWWRSDYSNTPLETWLAEIDVPDPGIPVSSEAFSVAVTAGAQAAGLQLQVTYATQDDHVRTVSAGAIEEGTANYEAALEGAERISSITFLEEGLEAPSSFDVEHQDAVAGDPIYLASWTPLSWRGSGGTIQPVVSGVSLTVDTGAGHVVGGIAPPMGALPALVSPEVARSQGSAFVATIGGQRLDVRQVAPPRPSCRSRGLRRRLDAGAPARGRSDPRARARDERGVGDGRGRSATGPRGSGIDPGSHRGGRADHRRARAAAAVPGRRDELRDGRGRARPRGARRGGRAVLRAAPPGVRVRVAAGGGNRAEAGDARAVARAGADDHVRPGCRRGDRVRDPAAADALRRPEHRVGVPPPILVFDWPAPRSR
jgi:hypothetical protein